MRKIVFCAIPMVAMAASAASGAIVYDNAGFNLFEPGLSSIFFDDATTTGTTPFKINQVDLAYDNVTNTSKTFDVLIQFFDTVNYAAAAGAPIGTNPIGSLIILKNQTLAANSIGDTGMITLTSANLPVSTTGTVGFEFEYVTPGTTAFSEANISSGIHPVFETGTPLIGSSSDDFAFDYLNQSTIVGDASSGDVFAYSSPSANIDIIIGGTAVPEPGSISLLAAGSVMLLSRRKRVTA